MVKFELEDDDFNEKESKTTKKVGDLIKDKIKTNMNHTRICPECGEEKVIIELVEMCIDCVNKTADNTIIPKKEDSKELKHEENEEELIEITPLEVYKKQYPKKKPIYQRGGKEVETKHFKAWKNENAETLQTAKEIEELVEKNDDDGEFDKEMILFLDSFCIHAKQAKKYKGTIKTGKGINTEFLKWYLNNTKKDFTKLLDYKKMGVKNQRIVREFLEIKDDKKQENVKKDGKAKKTVKSEPIIKKSGKTLDKISDHRRKSMKKFVSGLKEDGKEFDFLVLKDMTVEILKKDLQNIPEKELQMCFYLVVSQVEFLYKLMISKMTFKSDDLPTDGQIEAIKQIEFMLGKVE